MSALLAFSLVMNVMFVLFLILQQWRLKFWMEDRNWWKQQCEQAQSRYRSCVRYAHPHPETASGTGTASRG